MKFYAARHGETVENASKQILGSLEGTLNATGFRQAQELAANTNRLHIGVILCSPLKRVVQTFAPVREANPEATFELVSDARERNFGTWEGKLRKSVNWSDLWEGFAGEPELSKSIGAETLGDFTCRIAGLAIALYEKYDSTDRHVLLGCHIGVLNRLNYLTNPDRFEYIEYPNGQAVEFDLETIARNGRELLARQKH